MPSRLNLTDEERVDRIRENARNRAKKYYNSKKDKQSGINYVAIVRGQRNQINNALIGINVNSIKYLGCSVEYFRKYFKSKMVDGMNLNNIEIDHIKPVSAFKFEKEDDLNLCCHYTNFQPLFTEDNNRKGGKWSETDEIFWNENIKGKEYLHLYMPFGYRQTTQIKNVVEEKEVEEEVEKDESNVEFTYPKEASNIIKGYIEKNNLKNGDYLLPDGINVEEILIETFIKIGIKVPPNVSPVSFLRMMK